MLRNLPNDWKELLEILNKHDVRYLLVGGVAANFYGQPRFTQDIDFLVARDEKNAQQIIRSLEEFGFGSLGLSSVDFQKPNYVVQLGKPPHRVDFLTGIDGVEFESAWVNRQEGLVQNVKIPIISVDDLLKAKRAAGRLKDLSDIEVIEKTQKK